MSVDNTNNDSVSTRAAIDTDKPSSQSDTDTLSSSSYTPITASTSKMYPSAALPDALTSYYKSHNMLVLHNPKDPSKLNKCRKV